MMSKRDHVLLACICGAEHPLYSRRCARHESTDRIVYTIYYFPASVAVRGGHVIEVWLMEAVGEQSGVYASQSGLQSFLHNPPRSFSLLVLASDAEGPEQDSGILQEPQNGEIHKMAAESLITAQNKGLS